MDRITIRRLRLETILGLLPWEREARQTLLVDLDIDTDITAAAEADDIDLAINYAGVCERVTALVDTGRFKLIETVAEQIATLVLREFSAVRVKVTVNKVDVLPQVASVGVCIERHRAIDQSRASLFDGQ